MDYTIKIGGEAGQGIQTIGDLLGHIFAASGYHVFSHQDYESRIRGGNNFYQIRIADKPILSSRNKVDILVALDRESVVRYESELTQDGQILYDSELLKQKYDKPNYVDVPLLRLAMEAGGEKVMANTVAIGAVLGMLGMQPEIMKKIFYKTFSKKGQEILERNLAASQAGYNMAQKACLKCSFSVSALAEPKMLISGNEAIALGAISSGLKFYSAYPMTPSTGIMNFIAEHAEKLGIVVEQAEDEIAAVNMVIGASFAGVRSMTATSGGGFALMVEGLSLAGMTETPLVIVLGQRPGPATGFPTRTEAADLFFALFAGHGEFARILLAPGTPEQAFYLTNKAFDLAEKYQVPVIILSDQYLADSQWSYDKFDLDRLLYKDYRLRGEAFDNLKDYQRHVLTESGISPLAVPGEARHLVVTDSDEHDEAGHITEEAFIRIKMVEKRLFKKISLIRKEIEPPIIYGHREPEVILVCWGSMFGVVKELVDHLSEDFKIAMLHFKEIYPFSNDESWLKIFENRKLVINIEQNATSQLAKLLAMETGIRIDKHINRFDGRPFTLDELKEKVDAYLK